MSRGTTLPPAPVGVVLSTPETTGDFMPQNPSTVAELHLAVVRDYVRKDDFMLLQKEVAEIRSELPVIRADIGHIREGQEEIKGTLTWLNRLVLGAVISGGVIAAAYFIAFQTGAL